MSSQVAYCGPERRVFPRSFGLSTPDGFFTAIRGVLSPGQTVGGFLVLAGAREIMLRQTPTFREAAARFRLDGRPTRYLDRMVEIWGDTYLPLIDKHAIYRAAAVHFGHCMASTQNRVVLSVTQAVVNHAIETNLYKGAKLSVRRLPELRREKTPVDWPWIQAFRRPPTSPHLGALAVFMFSTGARVSEAISLTWSDIDVEGSRAYVRQTKTAKEGWRDLTPTCLEALLAIPSERRPAARVFGYASRHSAKRPWRTACRRAGIQDHGFHACRHGFATSMLHAGYDPATVAAAGGWANAVILLKVYAHANRKRGLANVLTEGGARG